MLVEVPVSNLNTKTGDSGEMEMGTLGGGDFIGLENDLADHCYISK